MFSYNSGEVEKVAVKLHKQFGHPSASRLVSMVRNSGMKDANLENKISQVTDECETCKKFQKSPPRPVVSVPLADNFNDVISMDLKSYGKSYFLVIVDLYTKFCAATVINDKNPSTILQNLFVSWIAIFGPSRKI